MANRSYVFTINLAECEKHFLLDFSQCDYIRYAVYQLEIGENGNEHFQGYLELSRACRFTQIARSVKGMELAHFEVRRGTPAQARDYAMKDDSRLDGPFEYGDWSAVHQGKRNDLISAMELLENTKQLPLVLSQYPATFARYFRGMEKALSIWEDTKNRPTPEIIFHYGEPGTGKTHWIFNNEPNLFMYANSDKWFDGFNGTDALLLDDFYGQYPFSKLLRLLDKYPFSVETKGGTIWVKSPKIYLTSNTLPSKWYAKLLENHSVDIRALFRRITKVRWFREGPPNFGFLEFSDYGSFEETVLRRSF